MFSKPLRLEPQNFIKRRGVIKNDSLLAAASAKWCNVAMMMDFNLSSMLLQIFVAKLLTKSCSDVGNCYSTPEGPWTDHRSHTHGRYDAGLLNGLLQGIRTKGGQNRVINPPALPFQRPAGARAA